MDYKLYEMKGRLLWKKMISKIAAIGVPGLVLIVAIGASGLAGGAAIVAALAALGPGGIIGGIATLGVIGIISDAITEYGISAVFKSVVKELYKQGETKETIINKIEKYPITNSLKNDLKALLNEIQD